MLTKEALEYLANVLFSHSPAAIDLKPGDPRTIPMMVLPEGMKATSVEQFMPAPARFRGKFASKWIGDFARFFGEHHNDGSTIYIDQDKMQAVAHIDHGDTVSPGWRQFTASLTLEKTAEYLALIKKDRESFGQVQFVNFILDWDKSLSFFSSPFGDLEGFMDNKKVARLISSMTVDAYKGFSSNVTNRSVHEDSMESLETKATNGERLPEWFIFKCKPYEEIAERHIGCAITYQSQADKTPVINFRIVGHETLTKEISDEFMSKLGRHLESLGIQGIGAMIFQGSLS